MAEAVSIRWHGICLSKSTETNSLVQALIKKAEAKLANPSNTGKRTLEHALIRREFCGCQRLMDGSAGGDEPGRGLGGAHARRSVRAGLGRRHQRRLPPDRSVLRLARASPPTSCPVPTIVRWPRCNARLRLRNSRTASRWTCSKSTRAAVEQAPVIVAWIEHGAPDLELDALRARPSRGAVYGVGQSSRRFRANRASPLARPEPLRRVGPRSSRRRRVRSRLAARAAREPGARSRDALRR